MDNVRLKYNLTTVVFDSLVMCAKAWSVVMEKKEKSEKQTKKVRDILERSIFR